MDDQLQELINLQKEQNQLLKKYLWRFRFSLMALLLLTTATAIGLGVIIYQARSKAVSPFTYIPPARPPASEGYKTPTEDIRTFPLRRG